MSRIVQNTSIENIDNQDILDLCAEILTESPIASGLMEEAIEDGWAVSAEQLDDTDFYLELDDKVIILNNNGMSLTSVWGADYFRNALVLSLLRALRDVWQEKTIESYESDFYENGLCIEDMMTVERIRAADIDTVSILCAWQLRQAGYEGLWRHTVGTGKADVALAFFSSMEKDPQTAMDDVLRNAFAQWFRNHDRVKNCDHDTLNYIDELIKDGSFHNGTRRLNPIEIEQLSFLPDETAYLESAGAEILSMPLFACVNDPVNEAHLDQLMYDMRVTFVQGVPFRDSGLAFKIFPNGELSDIDI